MFPSRFFPLRFFAERFWPKVGDVLNVVDAIPDVVVQVRSDVDTILVGPDVSTIQVS